MTEFTISLAGVAFGVRALHSATQRFCGKYLTEEEPAFSVVLSQEDIDEERLRSAREDEREGVPTRHFPDAYLETLALYRKLAAPLLARDTLIFHGAAVAAGGRAYLFTAPSGTGKTTHVRLWLDQIPGAHVLNGDKPLLKISSEGVWVCGTPWPRSVSWSGTQPTISKRSAFRRRWARWRSRPTGRRSRRR